MYFAPFFKATEINLIPSLFLPLMVKKKIVFLQHESQLQDHESYQFSYSF